MVELAPDRVLHRLLAAPAGELLRAQALLDAEAGLGVRRAVQPGVLVEAVRKGHWIILDELNLAPSDVLEALNRLLDDNRELRIAETQEVVTPHPDFMLFATQNPAGGAYGGRKLLSRAFRNRFLEMDVESIPDAELEDILHRRTALAPPWCGWAVRAAAVVARVAATVEGTAAAMAAPAAVEATAAAATAAALAGSSTAPACTPAAQWSCPRHCLLTRRTVPLSLPRQRCGLT